MGYDEIKKHISRDRHAQNKTFDPNKKSKDRKNMPNFDKEMSFRGKDDSSIM